MTASRIASAIALLAATVGIAVTPASAAPCRDSHGKFASCAKVAAKPRAAKPAKAATARTAASTAKAPVKHAPMKTTAKKG